ncbi:hypothetical protein MXD81_20310, partial [Microbacteriaceae bacterium K1510]|nr:hypothetical protein [Microbacteriaceae bacterium K1510]
MAEEEKLTNLPEERLYLAGALTGQWVQQNWLGQKQLVDFFLVKGLVEALFARLGINGAEYKPSAELAGMHPGRTAEVWFGNHRLG